MKKKNLENYGEKNTLKYNMIILIMFQPVNLLYEIQYEKMPVIKKRKMTQKSIFKKNRVKKQMQKKNK